MNSERADMYHTLTLLDNQFVKNIPDKLSRVLQSILKHPLPMLKKSELSTYHYFGEQCCDVLALLRYLSKASSQAQNEFTEFADFLRSSVIADYKTGGKLYDSSQSKKLCGLGLYFPETKQTISRYRSLTLYRKVDLIGLYKEILQTSNPRINN